MTLRVTVEYHPNETPLSLVSRLAVANGYSSIQAFLAINGVSAAAFEKGKTEAISLLSKWSGYDHETLCSNNITSGEASVTWRLGRAVMSKDMRIGHNHRYCPKCLLEDMVRMKERPQARPYARATWMTRAVEACSAHHCAILERPIEKRGPSDFARFVADNLPTIEQEALSASAAVPISAAEYVCGRIAGELRNQFLDQLEAYVAIDLCRYLGRFTFQHQANGTTSPEPLPQGDIDFGYQIASQGPSCIEETIADIIAREKPLVLEMRAFFGDLRKWLLRNKNKADFLQVVELFQDIAERNLPVGQDELFVVPTRRRYLHSVRSASIEYRLLDQRVYQLVVAAGLAEPSSLSNGRIYFDAQKGHEILSQAANTMTATEAASELGVHVERMHSIFDAKLIPRVEVSSEDSRVYSRVRRSDFEAFTERLNVARATPEEAANLVDIASAVPHAMCTIVDIVEFALAGKLQSLRRLNDGGIISGLGIDFRELQILVVEARKLIADKNQVSIFDANDQNSKLLTTRLALDLFQMDSTTLRALKARNYIRLVDGYNPMTQRSHKYIRRESIEAFLENHITLRQIARRERVSTSTLRKKLSSIGIEPVFKPTGRCATFYMKAKLEDAGIST